MWLGTYLIELGVDAIWLAPIFTSPMLDFGYDISDYTAIDPLFGTLADFDEPDAIAACGGLLIASNTERNRSKGVWFIGGFLWRQST